MTQRLVLFLFLIFTIGTASSQTTNIVLLDNIEQSRLRDAIMLYPEIKTMYEEIHTRALKGLQTAPDPLEILHYEGLLDNDPDRIRTVRSFKDIDYMVDLIYAGYGTDNRRFREKAREIIIAWAANYRPTGNPINENKFTAFFWGYFLYKNYFSPAEREKVEKWLMSIAELELNREHTPNNNWEAKRLKIIGIVGCILQNKILIDSSIEGFKKFISTAYYNDGTSYDLKQRDALHYHISGLKPCIATFTNLRKFDTGFDLFAYTSEKGSSIKKSVEYVIPYATGEKKREEWRNTKVKLDRERAAAGLEKYQPGLLFDPEKAHSLFELACYYNPEWNKIVNQEGSRKSWIGFLNGPIIRK